MNDVRFFDKRQRNKKEKTQNDKKSTICERALKRRRAITRIHSNKSSQEKKLYRNKRRKEWKSRIKA
jgi:hypothetical protein